MYLNCSKIKGDTMKPPQLRLRTLAGRELGVIPFVHNLTFTINYSDVSTIEFDTPYIANGIMNPLYAALSSYHVIYTEEFGVYVITATTKSGDGVQEVKTVSGSSLEQMFQSKSLFLEEGTYNFWNPVDSGETILGRLVALDPSWSVGYVAPRLIGYYRKFDEYSIDALSFCYNDATGKYRCAFVFDTYNKTINVYDANEDAVALPIYMSYQNLVDTVDVDENIDEFATRLHLYGADNLNIREVNPTGADYIVNLDYFISRGDLDIKVGSSSQTLAERIQEWQASIAAKQTYYTGLFAAKASLTAQKLMEEAELETLNGELDTLVEQQNQAIQTLAKEFTDEGKESQQNVLDAINLKIDAKNSEIAAQESAISSTETDMEEYTTLLEAINNKLAYENYFTDAERKVLAAFLIDATVEEDTFVAVDVDTSSSGAMSTVTGTISVTDSDFYRVEMSDFGKTMYVITGGTLSIPNANLTADITRGTLDLNSNKSYILTGYLGSTSYNGHTFASGLITISGTYSSFSSDTTSSYEDEILWYSGTKFSFYTSNATTYFTVNVTDYQKYSVAMELYDFGSEALDDYAWPIYEFSVDSANFLYHEKFEPFKNNLELGKAVYLELGSEGLIKPKIIGMELDFEDISKFSLIFSNRFQRKSKTFQLIEDLQSTSRSSRKFDASSYLYNRVADKTSQVDDFMNGQLVAAVNNIVNKEDQTVVINGSGINIGGNSNYQIRIVDNMICMTDDNWKTAKLAIGLFSSEETGTQWGMNAEVLAGKLLIGNNMVLQNATDNGVMMFQVDATGAWLYNATYCLQSDYGGCILIDPVYGIAAGNSYLYSVDGTTVYPSFIDSDGDITTDSDGLPTNANFYLDIRDGSAYFRGKVVAQSGEIGGFSISNYQLNSTNTTSKYNVGMNGDGLYSSNNPYYEYAFWAGATNPANAPFWVKKTGELKATDGTFTGTVYAKDGEFSGALKAATGTFTGTLEAGTIHASSISGALTAEDDGELVGPAIYVPTKTNPKFKVDSDGNVTMSGNINMSSGNLTLGTGSISWNNLSGSVQDEVTDAQDAAKDAATAASNAQTTANTATDLANKIANGQYSGGTFIDGTSIYSPEIYTNDFSIIPKVMSPTTGNVTKYTNGSFSLWAYASANAVNPIEMFEIYYRYLADYVIFSSPAGYPALWDFDSTIFNGNVNFENATVTGITATFG